MTDRQQLQIGTSGVSVRFVSRLGFLGGCRSGVFIAGPCNGIRLSGGEAQRIRLATQIGSGLVGVAYILDEPSIGLHQRDNDRLIATLQQLT